MQKTWWHRSTLKGPAVSHIPPDRGQACECRRHVDIDLLWKDLQFLTYHGLGVRLVSVEILAPYTVQCMARSKTSVVAYPPVPVCDHDRWLLLPTPLHPSLSNLNFVHHRQFSFTKTSFVTFCMAFRTVDYTVSCSIVVIIFWIHLSFLNTFIMESVKCLVLL